MTREEKEEAKEAGVREMVREASRRVLCALGVPPGFDHCSVTPIDHRSRWGKCSWVARVNVYCRSGPKSEYGCAQLTITDSFFVGFEDEFLEDEQTPVSRIVWADPPLERRYPPLETPYDESDYE